LLRRTERPAEDFAVVAFGIALEYPPGAGGGARAVEHRRDVSPLNASKAM
jgi:hypothetical protein